MLTGFQNYFTVRLGNTFLLRSPRKIPTQIKAVATLSVKYFDHFWRNMGNHLVLDPPCTN